MEGGEKASHTQQKSGMHFHNKHQIQNGKESGKSRFVRQWIEALWSRDSHISPEQLYWEGPATPAFEDIEGHAESAREQKMTGELS